MQNGKSPGINPALAATERAGLRIVLAIRNAIVTFGILFIGVTQGLQNGWFGMSVISVFLGIGLVYRWLVVRQRDRQWMRYAFASLDMALLGLVAAVIPLSMHGEVPQIFVFRVYGAPLFFFLLATSALSLSPRLVMWTGASAVVALWTAWGWIVWQMERRVTWAQIADDRSADTYIRIVLDPDHIQLANRVTETALILAASLVTAVAVARARRLLHDQVLAEQARGRVAEVFGRFVPEEVAERLSDADGTLPPARHQASVLFLDIQGFTHFAEQASPNRIVEVLDAFFDRVSDAVTAERGVVISFIGDAALAAFNAPLDNTEHAAAAMRTARRLLDIVKTEVFAGETLAIRVGIATGPVAAATVGGRGRRAYTLYGDTVNLAQRLEAKNKELGTTLLVDGDTWDAANRPGPVRAMGEMSVRGRERPVQVFAPKHTV
ncbi:MAG: adenylate/guanylate cyclase domain-containing protein [Pseudomonadota bacterium]